MDTYALRKGLSDAASAITGLNCTPYMPDVVSEPHFYAGEVDIDFDSSFGRGMDEVTVTCRMLIARADAMTGQAALDEYLSGSGSKSIKAALEAARGAPGSPAMDGACDDFQVVRVQSHRLYLVGDTQYYGAEFIVRCIGSGTS